MDPTTMIEQLREWAELVDDPGVRAGMLEVAADLEREASGSEARARRATVNPAAEVRRLRAKVARLEESLADTCEPTKGPRCHCGRCLGLTPNPVRTWREDV